MVDSLRSRAETMSGMIYGKYEAISYRNQAVVGMNYHIKVSVANQLNIVILNVFRSPSNELKLENVEWLYHG